MDCRGSGFIEVTPVKHCARQLLNIDHIVHVDSPNGVSPEPGCELKVTDQNTHVEVEETIEEVLECIKRARSLPVEN